MIERTWNGRENDDGSMHVLGNGRICAYEQGPDLVQMFGPPYSGPQWGALLIADEGIHSVSRREAGTAIWTHELSDSQGPLASFTDCAVSDSTVLVRRFACRRPVRLRLQPGLPQHGGLRWVDDTHLRMNGEKGVSLYLFARRGLPYYNQYPFLDNAHAFLQIAGAVSTATEESDILIRLEGEGMILLAGGPDLPTALRQAECARRTGAEALIARTRAAWQAFTARRAPISGSGTRIADMADSVAVLIAAQQAECGAVLAGHRYHQAYVRDQYGVAKGLLELGLTNEARAILEYYWGVWQTKGAIHTAQPMGTDGPFHIHEEDRSENTGYLVNLAMDWLDVTGDDSLVEGIQPMLEWAIDQQLQIAGVGTLPFSGDETYVACGMMPRDRLDHGSAEATLLFIHSTRRFAAWAVRRNRWTPRRRDQVRMTVDAVAALWHERFYVNGRIMANDPSRGKHAPRFRHGVCGGPNCTSRLITWLERDAHGNYLCPFCLAEGCDVQPGKSQLEILSVSLVPSFVGDGPLTADQVRMQVSRLSEAWLATGRLPSQVGSDGGTVGYDYGLLLLGMDRFGLPGADKLAEVTLGLLDPAGAFVECYQDGVPYRTRCRPWESAINCLALLNHEANEKS